jgi:hypothetical protein
MTSPNIIRSEGTSELMHIDQAVMTCSEQEKHFANNGFNCPTPAGHCKPTAFDGIKRLG